MVRVVSAKRTSRRLPSPSNAIPSWETALPTENEDDDDEDDWEMTLNSPPRHFVPGYYRAVPPGQNRLTRRYFVAPLRKTPSAPGLEVLKGALTRDKKLFPCAGRIASLNPYAGCAA